MNKPTPKIYRTTNWSSYNRALINRGNISICFGFVQSLIKLCGLNWTAPDYSTLCRRQKHIDIVISYQKSSDGLHLLMDSTGMKFLGEGEWKRKKHGPEYRRQWRKLHIGIDTKTLLGRTLWKKWSGYHRRSLVETKMHCIKLLGDKLMARSFPSQMSEIHARVAVLNRFTELGRPLTQVTP